MKSDKTPVIGFMCVMLSCILVLGITIGLLSSAKNNTVTAGSTTDTTDTKTDNTPETPEEPSVDEPDPEPEPELQWGYKFENFKGDIENGLSEIAYKIKKRTLKINEVKLTVSFGVWGGSRYIEDCNIPEYKIYFAETKDYKEYSSIYTVKTVKEQIFSEEYEVSQVYDEDRLYYYYEFAHSEEITVPRELFTESEGFLTLCVGGKNVAEKSHFMEDFIIGIVELKYQLNGKDEVVLSPRWEW